MEALIRRIAVLEDRLDKLAAQMSYEQPAAHAYNTANISILNATQTALTFNAEYYDTDTIHDLAVNTGRLTCNTPGKYLIIGHVEFAANATGYRQLVIRLNNTTDIAWQRILPVNGADPQQVLVATIRNLAATDYLELRALQTSGGALNAQAGNASPNFMMIRLA